jgi:hypothetical protein
VKRRDRGWNSILIVLTVGGVGCFFIVGPLHAPLHSLAEQVRAGQASLAWIVGIAYAVGFFVTRIVEDAFDAIFSKAPFSDIDEEVAPGKERKHPGWIDHMLSPLAYSLFLGRVILTMGLLALAIWALIWIVMHTKS